MSEDSLRVLGIIKPSIQTPKPSTLEIGLPEPDTMMPSTQTPELSMFEIGLPDPDNTVSSTQTPNHSTSETSRR